jgi:hypothetical protein
MRGHSLFAIGLLVLTLTGCAGYKLGPTNGTAAGEKSVQIKPFANQTPEPYLTDAVTTEVRKRLQQDGTYRLDSHGTGDIILTGVITKYNRQGLSYQPNDNYTVQDYRLFVTAQITARSRTTGQVIVDRAVTGYATMRVTSDLVSAERQTLPILANDLAKNVVALLAEGSW